MSLLEDLHEAGKEKEPVSAATNTSPNTSKDEAEVHNYNSTYSKESQELRLDAFNRWRGRFIRDIYNEMTGEEQKAFDLGELYAQINMIEGRSFDE